MVKHVGLLVRHNNPDKSVHKFAETFEQSSQDWNRNDSTNNPGDRRISILKGYRHSWKYPTTLGAVPRMCSDGRIDTRKVTDFKSIAR